VLDTALTQVKATRNFVSLLVNSLVDVNGDSVRLPGFSGFDPDALISVSVSRQLAHPLRKEVTIGATTPLQVNVALNMQLQTTAGAQLVSPAIEVSVFDADSSQLSLPVATSASATFTLVLSTLPFTTAVTTAAQLQPLVRCVQLPDGAAAWTTTQCGSPTVAAVTGSTTSVTVACTCTAAAGSSSATVSVASSVSTPGGPGGDPPGGPPGDGPSSSSNVALGVGLGVGLTLGLLLIGAGAFVVYRRRKSARETKSFTDWNKDTAVPMTRIPSSTSGLPTTGAGTGI